MLIAYTDGGKHRDRGSWAYVIVSADPRSISLDYNGEVSGPIISYGFGQIKNMRSSAEAEIVAASRAIMKLAEKWPKQEFMLVSDSTYVVYGLRDPFRMSQNVNYEHLWKPLVKICMNATFTTHHVKGHTRHSFNTLVDFMCNEVKIKQGNAIPRFIKLFNNNKTWRASLVKSSVVR